MPPITNTFGSNFLNQFGQTNLNPYGLVSGKPAAPTVQKPIPKTTPTVSNPAATSPKSTFINNALTNNSSLQVDSAGNPFGFMNDNASSGGNAATTPDSTVAPPDPYGAYKTAAQSYFNSLTPSAATTSAKQKYADFVANANLGISNIEGQGRGIPLTLVRGQQEKLYNQSQIEAQREQGDIALAQEADTASQNQASAKMQFEQSLLKPASNPVSVAQGSSLVDPLTGKTIFSSPAKEDNPTGIVGEYNDALRLGLIPKTTTLQQFVDDRKPTSTTVNNYGGSLTGNPAADSWVANIRNGTAKLSDVPAALKNAVSAGLANNTEATPLKQDALQSAKDLLTAFGSGGAVGTSRLLNLGLVTPGSQSQNFVNKFNTLKSQLSLDAVKYLKGQGAVSDAERQLLADSVTSLNLNQSDDEFKKTLNNIIKALSGAGTTSGGSTGSTPDYGSLYGF